MINPYSTPQSVEVRWRTHPMEKGVFALAVVMVCLVLTGWWYSEHRLREREEFKDTYIREQADEIDFLQWRLEVGTESGSEP